MSDSNMTIGAELSETTSGRKARLRKVVFTHTSADTAIGYATTTFTITGTILRVITTGGDSSWTITLNDGTADIWAGTSSATATSFPVFNVGAGASALTDDETHFAYGIPLVDQTLTCTTGGVASTAPTITVIWEESPTI